MSDSEEEKELEASICATFKLRECLLTIINVCEGKAGPETVPVRRKKDLENTQFVLGLCSACGTILQELSTDLVQAEEKRDLLNQELPAHVQEELSELRSNEQKLRLELAEAQTTIERSQGDKTRKTGAKDGAVDAPVGIAKDAEITEVVAHAAEEAASIATALSVVSSGGVNGDAKVLRAKAQHTSSTVGTVAPCLLLALVG